MRLDRRRSTEVCAKLAIGFWAVYSVLAWVIVIFGSSDDGLHVVPAGLSIIGVFVVLLPALGVLTYLQRTRSQATRARSPKA